MNEDINIAPEDNAVTDNTWNQLNRFTAARIGLGRAGISLPTKHLLAFQLAHAKAQDAVHTPLDANAMAEQLSGALWRGNYAPLILHSQVKDRTTYLQRPDHGRLLDKSSAQLLDQHYNQHPQGYDLAIAVVDGLSALAIKQNTLPFLNALFAILPLQQEHPENINTEADLFRIAPICIVEQGRVAVGDDICQRLNAKCVLVLIGERPGLSSPDSMGLYLTWNAKVGCTDAYRNCISNIRPAGLNYQTAAQKARYLIIESRARKLSGIKLKDRSENSNDQLVNHPQQNFLVKE